ncbi:MAG: putative DksA/TraR family transcriptional regulator [Acidimicrobiales bacterium]|nr:putative DksA/TraR family transcriptional regulator [Acidimicrobiales bacterium]
MASPLTVAQHRSNLDKLRAETEAAIGILRATYEELDPEEAASDVGAGEDEGGSEGDLTRFERDRIRARILEDEAFLEVIDAATARSHERGWKNCSKCGEPIGDARLEALPATELCVTCKANRSNW